MRKYVLARWDTNIVTFRGHQDAGTGYSSNNYLKDSIDSQCDVFQFHFGGNSGEFIIGKDKKVVLLPESNLKVSYSTGTVNDAPFSSITSFTLTTEDGTRYLFSEKEITVRSSGAYFNAYRGYVSAWYLKQIIAPFGIDTIAFNYKENVSSTTVQMPSSRMDDGQSDPIIRNETERVQITHKNLSQIVLPYNLKVEFNYDNYNRCDVSQQFALKSIEVRDTLLYNGYQFNYKYFTETAGKEYAMDGINCPTDISKLKLQSVTPYNQFGLLPAYEFGYSNLGVPKPTNKGRDHWGFFNGKNNVDLFPPVGPYSGADRNPDPQYVKAGTLTSIQYPNGSKTVFDFEINDAGLYYYSEYKSIATGPSAGNSAVIYLSNLSGNPITLSLKDGYRLTGCYLNYTLKNSAGAIVDQFSSPQSSSLTFSQRQINVPAGNYTLSWEKGVGSCTDEDFPLRSVSWTNEMKNLNYQLVGGLRIKQITLYDRDLQKPPLIRKFNYRNSNGTSAGFLVTKPAYDYTYEIQSGFSRHYYTTRISEPINNLNFINGGVVGYSKVDEIIPTAGKTTYEYSTYAGMNYFPPQFVFPFADVFMPTWLAGLPLKQSVFDEGGKKLFQTENIYDASFQPLIDTLYKCMKLNATGYYDLRPNDPYYAQSDYYPFNGKVLCTSKIETRYSDTDSSVSNLTMTYDSRRNLKTAKTLLNKKAAKYQETRLYYPNDYTLGGAVKQMKDSGINIPIATEKWLITPLGEYLTDMSISDFQFIDNGGIAVKNIYTFQAESPVVSAAVGVFNPAVLNRIPSIVKLSQTIDKFDSKSISIEYTNTLEQAKEAIIWDDKQQVSLASVINAGYNEIAYSSFETDNNGRWQLPPGASVYNTSLTGRKSFRFTGNISTTVTTGKKYIVTYWTTGASAVVNGTQGIKLKTRQGWNLYSHLLDVNTSTIAVSGSALTIDELRAYPVNARMNTQTPEPYLGIISKCDALNNVKYFSSDDQGRNRIEKDEYGNILSLNCYGRPGQQVDCNAVYQNYEMRFPYVQKNCTSGIPDTIIYVVPAGKYSSSVGQYTVDSLGIDDANKNGQAFANAQGTCGTVYVKLVYENFYLNSAQAVAYFYADAACTRPRNVKNLVVNFTVQDICEYINHYSVTANGTSCFLTSEAYYYYQKRVCDDYGNNCQMFDCYIDCTIDSGNYIVK
jgi:hypothetical protein